MAYPARYDRTTDLLELAPSPAAWENWQTLQRRAVCVEHVEQLGGWGYSDLYHVIFSGHDHGYYVVTAKEHAATLAT
jgi:hypothetical protein